MCKCFMLCTHKIIHIFIYMFKPFYKSIKGRKFIKYGIEILFQRSFKKQMIITIIPLGSSKKIIRIIGNKLQLNIFIRSYS